jgi:GGDEF domain-containing protein
VHRLRWRSALGPTVFALVSIALLIYDHLNRRIDELVFWLTLGLIVTVFVRMVETVRRQSAALRERERETLNDPLTGLGNSRMLSSDLDTVCARHGERWALVLFELDGLQAHSDRFGSAAGDELLRRAAHTLVHAVEPLNGAVYRIETTRLAALVPCGESRGEEIVLAVTAALGEGETDSGVGRLHGAVTIPEEAEERSTALQIAGQRLAAHKQRQHRSARRQAHAVLIAALCARQPELRDHLRGVTYRAIALARRLGVGVNEIDDIALASDLQDVGLLAVPESILDKEAPLGEFETAAIRSHTVDGERIIAAAPGLVPIAALVRSSAERFDGTGYPDGLAGEGIPLGSRIIAVSVAFAALTARRPYRAGMNGEEALAELRRCAGTQFDPRIVDALAADLAEEATPVGAPG